MPAPDGDAGGTKTNHRHHRAQEEQLPVHAGGPEPLEVQCGKNAAIGWDAPKGHVLRLVKHEGVWMAVHASGTRTTFAEVVRENRIVFSSWEADECYGSWPLQVGRVGHRRSHWLARPAGLVLRGLARGGLSLASERPTRNLAGAVHQAQCQRPGTCRGSGGHRAPAPCQTLKNLARSLAGVVIYGPDPRWQTCSKTCSNTLIV